jgi:hypothetical protein
VTKTVDIRKSMGTFSIQAHIIPSLQGTMKQVTFKILNDSPRTALFLLSLEQAAKDLGGGVEMLFSSEPIPLQLDQHSLLPSHNDGNIVFSDSTHDETATFSSLPRPPMLQRSDSSTITLAAGSH